MIDTSGYTMELARYCITTNQSLFINTMHPRKWFKILNEKFPEAKDKIKLHKRGVRIEKS